MASGMAEEKWETVDMATKYQINYGRRIGIGASGTEIFEGNFGGKLVAIKKIPHHLTTLYQQEIKIFREKDFSHPNLVSYIHSHQHKDYNFIVMELCCCNLTQYVQQCEKVSMATKRNILLQATTGLDYLHSKRIDNRDIKPDNILFSHPDVKGTVWIKVSDYGISRQVGVGTHFTTTGLGTFIWGPPESFEDESHVTLKSDIFSLGSVFYYVLSWGGRLFPELKKWIDYIPDFGSLDENSLEKQLITNLVEKDPNQRPDTQLILKHPMLWSEKRILDFLIDLSNILDGKKCSEVVTIEREIDRDCVNVLQGDWIQKLDGDVQRELNYHRGKKNQFNGKKVVDCIRALRNKATHFKDWTPGEANCFKSYPEGFFQYWFGKIPLLHIRVWEKIDQLLDNASLEMVLNPIRCYFQTQTEIQIKQEELELKLVNSINPPYSHEAKDFMKATITGDIKHWTDIGKETQYFYALKHNLGNRIGPNLLTNNERGLLHLAAQWDSSPLIDLILRKNKKLDIDIIDLEGNTPLHIASIYNSKKAAEKLIKLGAKINTENFEGLSPLHLCCLKNSQQVAELLIQSGFNTNTKDERGETPLHSCARGNHWQIAEMLVEKECQIDVTNLLKQTPLHLCSEKDSEEVARILLKNGANLNALDKKEESPLHYCSRNNSFKVAQLLMEQENILTNSVNRWGKSALHLSCIHNSKEVAQLLIKRTGIISLADIQNRLPIHYCAMNDSKEIAKILIENNSPLEWKDEHGWSPIHYCAMNQSHKVSKLLFQKNTSFNVMDNVNENWLHISSWFNSDKVVRSAVKCLEKQQHQSLEDVINVPGSVVMASPLHYCARRNAKDTADILVEKGANINKIDENSATPLHWCAKYDSREVAEILVSNGANVNAPSGKNGTPLHWCAKYNSIEVTEVLVSNGANVNVIDKYNMTPLHWCARNNLKEIAEMLVSNGANVNASDKYNITPLHWCARNNSKDVAMILVSNGAIVNAKDGNSETPWHWCAKNDSKEVAEILVTNGANGNAIDKYNMTPLHCCARNNSKDVAMILVSNGTIVNAKDGNRETPLHWCGMNNSKEVAEILVSKGANVNATDNNIETPLHWCARYNSKDVAEMLLSKGANVNAKDGNNETPLHWCAKNNFKEIAEILASYGANYQGIYDSQRKHFIAPIQDE